MPVHCKMHAAGYRAPRVVDLQAMRSSRVFQELLKVSRDPTYTAGHIQNTSRNRAKPLPLTAACPTNVVAGDQLVVRVDSAEEISQTLGAVLLPVETEESRVTWTNVGPRRPREGRQFISNALQLRLRQSTVMNVRTLRQFKVPGEEQAYIDVFGSFYQRDEAWRRDPSLVTFKVTAAAAATGAEGEESEQGKTVDETALRAVDMTATVTRAGNYNVYTYVEDEDGCQLLPCGPLALSVSPHTEPATEASRVVAATRVASLWFHRETDPEYDVTVLAGEPWDVEIHVCDQYGNAMDPSTLVDLNVRLVSPGGDESNLSVVRSRDHGVLRCTLDLTEAGAYMVRAFMYGQEMPSSPLRAHVIAARVSPTHSLLSLDGRSLLCPVRVGADNRAIHSFGGGLLGPRSPPLLRGEVHTHRTCELQLVVRDRFGNRREHGGVRVDAKAQGFGVSGASVEDRRDGSYFIRIIPSMPGEVRLFTRVDGTELAPVSVIVVGEDEVREREAVRAEGLRRARLAAAHALMEWGVTEEGLREYIVELAGLW